MNFKVPRPPRMACKPFHDTCRVTYKSGLNDRLPDWVKKAVKAREIRTMKVMGYVSLQSEVHATRLPEIKVFRAPMFSTEIRTSHCKIAGNLTFEGLGSDPVEPIVSVGLTPRQTFAEVSVTRLDCTVDVQVFQELDTGWATALAARLRAKLRCAVGVRAWPGGGWQVEVGKRGSPRYLRIYNSAAKGGARLDTWEIIEDGPLRVIRVETELTTKARPLLLFGDPARGLAVGLGLLRKQKINELEPVLSRLKLGGLGWQIDYESAGGSTRHLQAEFWRLSGRMSAVGLAPETITFDGTAFARSLNRTKQRLARCGVPTTKACTVVTYSGVLLQAKFR